MLPRTIPRTLISIRAYAGVQQHTCIRIIPGKLLMRSFSEKPCVREASGLSVLVQPSRHRD